MAGANTQLTVAPAGRAASAVSAGERARPHLSGRVRIDLVAGCSFVAPQAIGFLLFVFLPIVAVFVISAFDWNAISGHFQFIGLDNYASNLPKDKRALGILGNTIIFILGFMPPTVIIGLVLAILTNSSRPGMPVYRAIYFMPVVISLAAWAMVWRVEFQPEGALNGMLALVGIHGPNWLASKQFAMTAVIAVAILKNVGFTMVLFHAALQNVPRDVTEAARIDGAGDWAMFRHITLPLIAPFTFLVVILTTINSFKTFALFYVMTTGGPGDATRTLAYYIYDLAFRFSRNGYASALAVLLFVAVLLLTLGQFVIRQKWVHNET